MSMSPSFRLKALILFLALSLGGPPAAFAGKPYQYYVIGTPADVLRPQQERPSLALIGAGPDVDIAFKWMIQKSGGGNFVVIRAAGTDAYNAYIYAMGGVASVETIIIPSRDAANDPFVKSRISAASALFIAGGDQSDYANYWQGTLVQSAIQELAGRNVPIGGISAGLAVMGEYAFMASNGSIGSSAALSNPYDVTVTLRRDFLAMPDMKGLITETHLDARNRMGRLMAFMARIVNDGWSDTARGIGVDVQTALLVDDGIATLVGIGSAYFLQTAGVPEVCKPDTPLTYGNFDVQRLSGTGKFDLRNWSSEGGGTAQYSIFAIDGVAYSTQASGAIY